MLCSHLAMRSHFFLCVCSFVVVAFLAQFYVYFSSSVVIYVSLIDLNWPAETGAHIAPPSIGLFGPVGAINASQPEQRTEPHFLRPTTDQKSGWSYLHRGNPRRFSLNTPNKTVRLKLKKDQP